MTTHTIARHPNESDKAYAAFVIYATLGSERSLEKARQNGGKTAVSYTRRLEEWSSRYDWQTRVKLYDDALAQHAADEHAAQYLADVEAHRTAYRDIGKRLREVASEILEELSTKKEFLKPNVNTLATVARAFTTAADLEAHALKLDKLLPTLTNDSEHPQNP